MAQVAVERQRRQEEQSAIGSFLLFPFHLSLKKRRALRPVRPLKVRLETETQKGRSTREGSALLLIPDDIENHRKSGGRT